MEQIKTVVIILLAISLIVSLVLYIRLRRRKVNLNENENNRTWLSKNWIWLVSIAIIVIWANTFWALHFDQEEGLGDIGKFGDMFGAVNALFSGLAFAGMIYAIVLQSRELGQTNIEMKVQNEMLELQKDELAKTNEMMEQQTESLKLQNKTLKLQNEEMLQTRKEFQQQNRTLSIQRFENTFFQMISLHHEIIDKLNYVGKTSFFPMRGGSTEMKVHQDRFEKRNVLGQAAIQLENSLKQIREEDSRDSLSVKSEGEFTVNNKVVWEQIQKGYKHFYDECNYGNSLSHYFLNLYHIFKFIYRSNDISKEEKLYYASLVRAQLSPDELYLIIYNSMREYHGNPKFLFLIKFFKLTENYNKNGVQEKLFYQPLFYDLLEKAQDILDVDNPDPIKPDFQTMGN